MGALLARREVAKSLGPGTHASTFGGNPLVSAAGIAALRTINDPGLLEHCRSMGTYFMTQLRKLQEKYAVICDVRGKGLLIGLELDRPGAPIVNKCLEQGVLLNCVHENVLRFLPPLIVTEEEIDRVVSLLNAVISES